MAAIQDAEALRGLTAPTVTADEAGVLTIQWPDERPRTFPITADLFEQMIDDLNRFRAHSTILNQVAWRIAEALGDVGPGDEEHEGDVVVDLERLIASRA